MSDYVTLGIDREVFAIPVEHVQEILDVRDISRLPHAPAHLLGIIDVRGRAVPVIDLRTRLGLARAEASESTRILVIEVPTADAVLVLGLMADRVFEVTGLDDGEASLPAELAGRWRADFIAGLGRRKGGFVIILDVARLFDADDLAAVTQMVDAAA